MDTKLLSLGQEVLDRLAGDFPPSATPQLIAAWEGQVLLRDASGLREMAVSDISGRLDLAHLIDHTILRSDATAEEVDRLCAEARTHRFASVCVNGAWVARIAKALAGSPVRACAVVGFPLGAASPKAVALETQVALEEGADEIDMVLPVGLVKGRDWDGVAETLVRVREASKGACLKLILETCLLTDDEKRRACALAVEHGHDFVKTSTGFSRAGATVEDVHLMRESVGGHCGVKASGGIRDYPSALEMALAGATRLGLSSSLTVIGA